MKNIFTSIFLCFIFLTSAQIKLASHHLDLQKSSSNHQVLNAVNSENNQLVVFAADKDNCYVNRYNSALFFLDSLTVDRPDRTYDFMSGYSFENGNPTLFWMSENRKKIAAVGFDFATRQSKTSEYEIELETETFLTDFVINNVYYILTLPKTSETLKLYILKSKIPVIKMIDLSAIDFGAKKEKALTLRKILEENPLEKIEANFFQPLPVGVSKSKLFVLKNRLVFTFDFNNTATQTLEINLSSFETLEKRFAHSVMKNESKSNSYYHDDKLYQLKVDQDTMVLTIKEYKTQALLNTFSATKTESIAFKNSPLYIQSGNQSGREIKNTKKFFRLFAASDVGLTVYRSKNTNLLTIGGCTNVASAGDIFLGLSVGIANAVYGTGADLESLYGNEILQTVYFESLLDRQLQHSKQEPKTLAVDYIAGFLSDLEKYELESVFRYKDYYILGYYDTKAKQYCLWKFEDRR